MNENRIRKPQIPAGRAELHGYRARAVTRLPVHNRHGQNADHRASTSNAACRARGAGDVSSSVVAMSSIRACSTGLTDQLPYGAGGARVAASLGEPRVVMTALTRHRQAQLAHDLDRAIRGVVIDA